MTMLLLKICGTPELLLEGTSQNKNEIILFVIRRHVPEHTSESRLLFKWKYCLEGSPLVAQDPFP